MKLYNFNIQLNFLHLKVCDSFRIYWKGRHSKNSCFLTTLRKFQEQECPPSPEPTRKEKDKSGCHCVIVWVGLTTVTHAAAPDRPTHSAWHHILSGCLTAAFSTCMTSDSFFWDTLSRNCCPPGHRYGQLTMPKFNTTLPSAIIEFTRESKH